MVSQFILCIWVGVVAVFLMTEITERRSTIEVLNVRIESDETMLRNLQLQSDADHQTIDALVERLNHK